MPTPKPIRLHVAADGVITMLYTDALDLKKLGDLTVERASAVEYDNALGGWTVSFPDGTRLPAAFAVRQDALDAEVEYLSTRLGRLPRG